jgi:CRP-like cAMP-binding protein
LTKCELLQIADADYLRVMRALPDLAEATARLLAAKARWTAAIAEALAQFDATQRLVRILQLYLEQFGRESASGECVLDWGLTQSDLASLLGVRREWLYQILAQWRKRKLMKFVDGVITVPDLARLITEAK